MLFNSYWVEYLLLDQQKQPFNFLLEVKGCFYLNWYAGGAKIPCSIISKS